MAALYKEFTLKNAEIWRTFRALVKANAKAMNDAGTPLRVILTSSERQRNVEQNRYYWAGVLSDIEVQAWVGGRTYDKEVWHEHYAKKFGVCFDMEMPDGTVEVRRKSTTKMTVSEFSEYLEKVQADAAQELGVRFSVKNRY